MGTSSYVNQAFVRPKMTQKHPKTDWILIGVALGLTLFGLLMVHSAGPKFAMAIDLPYDFFLKRQALWAGVGLIGVLILSRFPYQYYKRLTVLMLAITLIGLILTSIIADRTYGANRSLFLGSIRPSELAKLVTIIYVAVWLNAKREVLNDMLMGLFPLMAILGITGGLIMSQPDFSAAITVIIMGGILFFLAGAPWRQIIMTMAVTSIIGWMIVNVYSTGMQRVQEYWAGLHNPLDASYHVQRSLEAIINGGVFGVGIAHGSTKFTGLPVAPTDSIFAVIAEEVGLLGSGAVILAFIVLLWRGLHIANQTEDEFGSLLASGITIWIMIEALLNMAVMVNLLPQAGNALPFISYGGSNLTITLAGIGILLNIARQSGQGKPSQGGSAFGAVVDLRWRDRRRGVSRSSRMPGTKQ
jgi:cell division protein FtsW